ncbi:MBL fold metallo-hydrolase [Streptomyces sp. DT2A-34]|uniref:MBL fold metallo-hydrolase n=1 Tax=Streptomyces sp. DT2A-34 TaxID=3051182 RepID=UPI003463EA56
MDWFGFDLGPEKTARVDLGGRVLECLATPGHHESAVTYYDPCTGWLLTGDTVYPGRLYGARLACVRHHCRPAVRVRGVPSGHARDRVPCRDDARAGCGYPVRPTYQPDERRSR